MAELERCDICGRLIMRVRVMGQELVADGMRIASVRIDQKPWAEYLTGRIVETYPHHSAMCKPKEEESGSTIGTDGEEKPDTTATDADSAGVG